MKNIFKSVFLLLVIFLSTISHARQTIYIGEIPNFKMFFVCDFSDRPGLIGSLCSLDRDGARIVRIYFRGIDTRAGDDQEQTWFLDCRRRAINYKSEVVLEKNMRIDERLGLKEGCRL
jgi:hypothetical protein